MDTSRHICISPNSDGRWKLWAERDNERGGDIWTEELFSTLKQARRFVPKYARLIGWEPKSYVLNIDE